MTRLSVVGSHAIVELFFSSYLRAARRREPRPEPAVNEDKYFSGYAEEFKLRVPDRAQAEQFALEAPTSDKAMKPLGLHTAWAYNDLDVVTSLLEEGVASLLRKKEIKE